MAGTVTCGTISDGTNSTSSTNCIQGSAKAWVSYNGVGGAIRASYNVTSVTKNGTGTYTVNFTNAFADSNYVANIGVAYTGGAVLFKGDDATAPTASSFKFVVYNTGGSVIDANYAYVAFFR